MSYEQLFLTWYFSKVTELIPNVSANLEAEVQDGTMGKTMIEYLLPLTLAGSSRKVDG